MTRKIGVRELARNSNILQGCDYLDIEDKKTHEYKGLFIAPKYADDIKKLIEQRIVREKEQRIDALMQFAGIADGDTGNMGAKEMRQAHGHRQ